MSEVVEKDKDITLKYIYEHKAGVQKWLSLFSSELYRRGLEHDNSKLKEPELSGWRAMDQEPRYKYGTEEYTKKIHKYEWLMKLHWSKNRHHPEYWDLHKDEKNRDLIDIIEMMVDWLSYRDHISYTEASELVKKQTKRYNFSEELSELILNTLTNYYIDFGFLNKENSKNREDATNVKNTRLVDKLI